MKKILFSMFLFFTISIGTVMAAYLKNYPVTVTQPDGTVLHCFATGDEYYNWLHDANGYTIIQHPQTGYYVYAQKQADSLIATNYIAERVTPQSVGLAPYINISPIQMEGRREMALSRVPKEAFEPKPFKKSSTPETLNNLVVFIRFSDQAEYTVDTTTYWNMFNDFRINSSSMFRFFQTTSYGKMNIPSTFYPKTTGRTVISYQDTYPRSYYEPYNAATNPNGYMNYQSTDREQEMLKRAIEYVSSQIPASLNLDYNNDGKVDNVCFIVKGATSGWSDLLWPHRSYLYSQSVTLNGKQVYDYNFQLSEHLNNSKASVLAHEMFHTFGAPDLYKYDQVNAPMTPVGEWDLMATNYPLIPQSMSAYQKNKYVGWVSQVPEITKNGFYSLKTVWSEDNCIYKIKSPGSNKNEYFTVEYRNKNSNYFDQGLPNSGLLIYRINPSLNGNGRSQDEVYIFRPNASDNNTNGNLSLAAYSANATHTVFNNSSNPPCFFADNSLANIYIRNVSMLGDSMTFEVVFPTKASPDFNASKTLIAPGCSIDFTNLTSGYANSYAWTFEGGSPASSTDMNPTGIVYNTAGQYRVELTVKNSYGDTTLIKTNFITVTTATPNINVTASDSIGCVLDTFQFFGNADICPQTWDWSFSPNTYSFTDGTSASSQNPKVLFNGDGSYTANLTVTNANGQNTLTKTNIVSMGGHAIENIETFEKGKTIESNGWETSCEANSMLWNIGQTNKGSGLEQSAYLQLIKMSGVRKSWLISPAYEMPNDQNTNYYLKFKHAYCLKSIYSSSDTLNIYASTDCGVTWNLLSTHFEDGNHSLATVDPSSSEFFPSSAADWCSDCIKVNVNEYKGNSSVKFKFEIIRAGGNNFYLDDIQISNTIGGIKNISIENQFILYPNPNTGIFTIKSSTPINNAQMTIYSIDGKMVYQSLLNSEKKEYNFSYLPTGMYFVKIIGKGFSSQLKFIKQ